MARILYPIAISSQLDVTGEERIHAAPYYKAARLYVFIITGDVPDGTIGENVTGAYTAIGGEIPYTFEVISGQFPPGLTLDEGGTYSGVFTEVGTFSWTIRATDDSGATATLNDTAEVEALYYSSTLYPLEVLETFTSSYGTQGGRLLTNPLEAFNVQYSIISGELKGILETYDNWSPDAVTSEYNILSGELETILIEYEEWPPEAITSQYSILSGTLEELLVVYDNYPPEAITCQYGIVGGSLS